MPAPITVTHSDTKIERDITRVICRQYMPSGDPERLKRIVRRIMQLSEPETRSLVDQTLRDFADRHEDLRETFINHFNTVRHYIPPETRNFSEGQQLLIGAYFTMEYAVESAAL